MTADSPDPLVRRECCNLLVHLLYSLSCKQLELQPGGAASEDHRRVAGVISQLQGLQGQQLWAREQPTLAAPVVPSAHAVASFVRTGRSGWHTPSHAHMQHWHTPCMLS